MDTQDTCVNFFAYYDCALQERPSIGLTPSMGVWIDGAEAIGGWDHLDWQDELADELRLARSRGWRGPCVIGEEEGAIPGRLEVFANLRVPSTFHLHRLAWERIEAICAMGPTTPREHILIAMASVLDGDPLDAVTERDEDGTANVQALADALVVFAGEETVCDAGGGVPLWRQLQGALRVIMAFWGGDNFAAMAEAHNTAIAELPHGLLRDGDRRLVIGEGHAEVVSVERIDEPVIERETVDAPVVERETVNVPSTVREPVRPIIIREPSPCRTVPRERLAAC